mmetsp:Transcript_33255/g.84667  ORF Transcript_33255/g.84667 Transcript_33255/m.84667 type:complete len:202 (+) Transcript_33255:411-1016(+)
MRTLPPSRSGQPSRARHSASAQDPPVRKLRVGPASLGKQAARPRPRVQMQEQRVGAPPSATQARRRRRSDSATRPRARHTERAAPGGEAGCEAGCGRDRLGIQPGCSAAWPSGAARCCASARPPRKPAGRPPRSQAPCRPQHRRSQKTTAACLGSSASSTSSETCCPTALGLKQLAATNSGPPCRRRGRHFGDTWHSTTRP